MQYENIPGVYSVVNIDNAMDNLEKYYPKDDDKDFDSYSGGTFLTLEYSASLSGGSFTEQPKDSISGGAFLV